MNRAPIILFLICFIIAHVILGRVLDSSFFMGSIGLDMPNNPFYITHDFTLFRLFMELIFAWAIFQGLLELWRGIQE